MRIWFGPVLVLAVILGAHQASAGLFSTTLSTKGRTDCSGLSLHYASGVPNGQKHSYQLTGICIRYAEHYTDGDHTGTDEIGRSFTRLNAIWDDKTSELKETLKMDDVPGSVSSVFKCGRDPYVYSTSCVTTSTTNSTSWPELSDKPKHNLPIGAGKTTLGEATANSAQHPNGGSAPPPPPPPPPPSPPASKSDKPAVSPGVAMHPVPPPPKVKISPDTRLELAPHAVSIEAESLAGTASSTDGNITAQPMGKFGSGWSDDKQLFWAARKGDAVLKLKLPGMIPGPYRLTLHLTRAPDYGILQVSLNGDPLDATFNGYYPSVVPSGDVDIGEVTLVGGSNVFEFHVVGKDIRSTGHYVGIDRIDLEPVK